ncbi:MAG TPA: lipid-A-disaccharide synthase [Xanthomonadaceae bacterium]|nr:lipid-A-disaccharide synthase [Xanthomonadaceae bacterium]
MSTAASRPLRVGLVAGEASGDQLGAGLVAAVRERFPEAEFAGIGGPAMRSAGCDTWWDCEALAVMGLAEVLAHLPRLLRLRRELLRRLLHWQPDVFVGIDAPDFNLSLERRLKSAGVGTVHYVSPSVWAWRAGRAARMGTSADRVLCLFPMEPPIYARHGIRAHFVGHPLADEFALEPDRAGARALLALAENRPVLAMLPGSRLGEIRRLLPVFLEAARLCALRLAALQIVIPAANAACRACIESVLADAFARDRAPPTDSIRILDGQARPAMVAADVVLLASGTAALEALLAKRPMVVAYRLAPASYAIVRALGLLKSRHVSLPNALAGEALVPELLQHECTPPKLAAALVRYFEDPALAQALQPRFRGIHETLRRDASRQAAAIVAQMVEAR